MVLASAPNFRDTVVLGETRWVERLAAQEGLPSAVVAQAWLDRDDVEDVLARQAACPLVRGIRHLCEAASILWKLQHANR